MVGPGEMHLRVFDFGCPLIVSPKRSHCPLNSWDAQSQPRSSRLPKGVGEEKHVDQSLLMIWRPGLGLLFQNQFSTVKVNSETAHIHTKKSLSLSEIHAHMEALGVWAGLYVRF